MTWNYIRRKSDNGVVDGPMQEIGVLEWDERPGATYEMHLDVEPEFHRQGVGRSMVEELIETVKKMEREPMSIYSFSSADNAKAFAFFSGMGFVRYSIENLYGFGASAYMWVLTIGAPK